MPTKTIGTKNLYGIRRKPPRINPFLRWRRLSDVPHPSGGAAVPFETVTFQGRQAILTRVTGDPDSSTGGDGSYCLNRNDGQGESWVTEGADTWISKYIYIPSASWQHSIVSAGWNVFLEFHEPGGIAPRSITWNAWGSDPPVWQYSCSGGDTTTSDTLTDVWVRDTQPIVMNKWIHWLIHMRWSRFNLGYSEWWIDGRQVVSRSSPNELFGSPGGSVEPQFADNYPTAWNHNGTFRSGYLECGHYRGPSRPVTEVTYFSDLMIGTTRESVGG